MDKLDVSHDGSIIASISSEDESVKFWNIKYLEVNVLFPKIKNITGWVQCTCFWKLVGANAPSAPDEFNNFFIYSEVALTRIRGVRSNPSIFGYIQAKLHILPLYLLEQG